MGLKLLLPNQIPTEPSAGLQVQAQQRAFTTLPGVHKVKLKCLNAPVQGHRARCG